MDSFWTYLQILLLLLINLMVTFLWIFVVSWMALCFSSYFYAVESLSNLQLRAVAFLSDFPLQPINLKLNDSCRTRFHTKVSRLVTYRDSLNID